jgi:ATP-dependent Clp protease adaptor protein ClpS
MAALPGTPPGNPGGGEPGSGTQTLVRPDPRTATPKFYKVVIHNDDFTPRDFVVHVLQRFFHKDETTATELMLQIHHRGLGIAGIYTHEIAETKAYQVNEYSKQNRYPLRTTVERDD